MSKLIVKAQEQNVNYLKTNQVKSGYVLRPVQYSRIEAKDLVEYCSKNSYVPKAFLQSSITAIIDAMENFLMNGHSIELPDFGTFSISCECSVAATAATAGMEQFKGLKINFRPATSLKQKIDNVDVELDGIYKCLDLSADNKVYEKITQSGNTTTPDTEGETEQPTPGGGGNSGGSDLEG